jgi:hypothetical protein
MPNRAHLLFGLLLCAVAPAFACQCEIFSTCNEVGATNLIFIGKVESIDPVFLNRWNPTSRDSMKGLNAAFLDAQQHPSNAALAKLKDAYLKAFPEASDDRKRQVASAKTATAISALFYSGVGRGMKIRLRVETLFKHADDDDPKKKAAKDDDDEKPEFFDVSTPFGDCGYSFQIGESYLVYASDDEESNTGPETDSCTRTRRVSDAGEDLAYLFFYKNHPDAATRLEGYTTTDRRYRVDFDPAHPELIRSPVGDLIIELQSAGLTRFVEADHKGRFIFDGLAEGDYKLSVFGHGYPADQRVLAGPQAFHAPEKSCALQVLVVPPEELKPK